MGDVRLVGLPCLHSKCLLELESFQLTHQRQNRHPTLDVEIVLVIIALF